MTIYVLGAGMSGLATAEKLLELGNTNVEILERSTKVGGLAQSFEWGGFEFNDLGPHIWHTPNNELANEWKNRFGELLVEGRFWGKNVIGQAPGEYFDYPISKNVLSKFDAVTRRKIENELKACTRDSQIRATNFNEYVNALVGPTLSQLFFKDYPEKLWGVSTQEMTANWAPKRIRLTEQSEEFHGSQWAGVGAKGSGGLIEVIQNNIINMGGKFRFDSEVTAIGAADNLISEIVINNRECIKISENDRIVSTIPFNILSTYLGFKNSLSYRGALLIYISLNKPIALPGNSAFLYFPQKHVPFHRLSEQKKFCSIGWPEHKTTLVAEIGFNEKEIDTLNLGQLINSTIDAIIEYGFATKNEILEWHTVSLTNVYPLLTKGSEVDFKSLYSKVQGFKQLFLIGTGGEFHYADIQILYKKGQDLAIRIDEDLKVEAPLKKSMIANIDESKFFPNNPFIVAEIGLNHGGSLNVAVELMKEAKNAGINYVKFQTYKSESRISQAYRSINYSEEITEQEENLFHMFKKFELKDEDWRYLFQFAKTLDIKMFCAVFDLESLDLLESLNCPAYKIASMDLNNYPLIEQVASKRKPIILSTGMSNLGEIERAVRIIDKHSPRELIILHCVSNYPANSDSINLSVMHTLRAAFGYPVGFSDHTIGLTVPIVAASIGAVCIEKHFTLSHDLEGPDHIFSLNPAEMTELVRIIDKIPKMIGISSEVINRQEIDTAFKFKKSLHAKRDIPKGHKIERDDLIIKGPYGGVAPEYLEILLGRIVKEKILADHPITWDLI